MTDRTCSVEGCDRPHRARGYCVAHWDRWQKSGDPGPALIGKPRRVTTCSARSCDQDKVCYGLCPKHALESVGWDLDPETGCHIWRGLRTERGYGVLGSDLKHRVHRVAWEAVNGRPVPEGLVVRHRCDNPPCCNPDHLEVGTHADNARDAIVRGRRPWILDSSECVNGHDLTLPGAIYSYRVKSGKVRNRCHECILSANRVRNESVRLAAGGPARV